MRALRPAATSDGNIPEPSDELLEKAVIYIEHLERLLRESQAEVHQLRKRPSLENRSSVRGIAAALQQVEEAVASLARQRLEARVGALGETPQSSHWLSRAAARLDRT